MATLSGTLAVDADFRIIQIAGDFLCEDGAASPVISPKTSIGTTPQKLTVPDNALICVLKGSAAIRYGENATLDGSATGKGYRTAAANTEVEVPVTKMSQLYVSAATGTVTVDFHFERLVAGT